MQFLFALGLLVASYFIQSLTQARPTKPDRAALRDFEFPQIDEGTPQIVVFGDVWITDWLVLWYGNYRTSEIKSDGGKK